MRKDVPKNTPDEQHELHIKLMEALDESIKAQMELLKSDGKPTTIANVVGNISILAYEMMKRGANK